MTRVCTVCTHPHRAEIDKAAVGGSPNRRIASQYRLSEIAVRRHKNDHLPAHLTKAADIEEEATATGLLARLRALNAETADVLKEARQVKDQELRLKAIARVEKQIELEGRLLGELQDGGTVNILIAPEWQAIRAALMAALLPYPEARIAAAESLAAIEAGQPSSPP